MQLGAASPAAMTGETTITDATLADAAEVAAVYAHHVLHGLATWEMVPPAESEIAGRMARVLDSGWPWLLARDGRAELLGYAYAARFHPRVGYLYTCEDSIYLHRDCLGRGIGTMLLAALIERCEALGFRQMIAGIAGGQAASVALHTRFGFREVARMPSLGRKQEQWLDLIYMQRALGEGDATPPPVEP